MYRIFVKHRATLGAGSFNPVRVIIWNPAFVGHLASFFCPVDVGLLRVCCVSFAPFPFAFTQQMVDVDIVELCLAEEVHF